jgi:hypothetical protein
VIDEQSLEPAQPLGAFVPGREWLRSAGRAHALEALDEFGGSVDDLHAPIVIGAARRGWRSDSNRAN